MASAASFIEAVTTSTIDTLHHGTACKEFAMLRWSLSEDHHPTRGTSQLPGKLGDNGAARVAGSVGDNGLSGGE